jgi:hypothetical protein
LSTVEIVTLIAMIVTAGWFSALVVQAIKQASWPSSVRLLAAGAVALAFALATSWLSGELSGFIDVWASGSMTAEQVFVYFSGIFTASQAWFFGAFKDAEWARQLELWPGKGG